MIKTYNPVALCLQETFLQGNDSMTLKNYSVYSSPALEENGRAHGGTSVIIRNDVAHSEIKAHNEEVPARGVGRVHQ